MARATRITTQHSNEVIVRFAEPAFTALIELLERRYPDEEAATFLRFGWRENEHQLVLTLAEIERPRLLELDNEVAHVAIDEAYTLRMALAADSNPLAIGVAHSHPVSCPPIPSSIDDDMDSYYGAYFGDFAPGRPYVSLITSRMNGDLAISGRVFWRGGWHVVRRILAAATPLRQWTGGAKPRIETLPTRITRVQSAFGLEAIQRLRRSTVAVVGAGGTGSAVIETLARGGVGSIIVVDPDFIEDSNLERIHGAFPRHVQSRRSKVSIAKEHVEEIDRDCHVVSLRGSLPQGKVVDAVITADVMIGCTDQQHSRLALSDICTRYLVPTIDCGVALEGRSGHVSGQIIQLLRFLPSDPCAYCRRLTNPSRVSQELMSADEREARRRAAKAATSRGDDSTPYWHDEPQLNTVGYLTTIAGALAASYAIGWLTGRFTPPFTRLQMNIVAPLLDVTDVDDRPDGDCVCRRIHGWADQALADAFVTAPDHWPPAEVEPD